MTALSSTESIHDVVDSDVPTPGTGRHDELDYIEEMLVATVLGVPRPEHTTTETQSAD